MLNLELKVLSVLVFLAGSVCCNDVLVGSINTFSLNLFDQINLLKPKENVVLSPFSLAMAMGMLQQGTLGETEKDIGATIFQGLKKEDVAQQFKQLKQVNLAGLLRENPNVTVDVANRVYVKNGVAVKKDFMDSLQNNFDATAESIDFSNKATAANKINSWVKDVTKGKIDQLLQAESIPDETSLLVLNAIYLKGLWLHAFKEESTRKDKFMVDGHVPTDVDMMHGTFSVFRSVGEKLSENFPVQSFVLQVVLRFKLFTIFCQ